MSNDELNRIRAVYAERQRPALAARYAPDAPAEVYGLLQRRSAFKAMLTRHMPQGLQGLRVLDVGCGRGDRLAEWVAWGGTPDKLVGVDLMPRLIATARQSYPDSAWLVASADGLPFPDASFDVVTQSMAVSSILCPDLRGRVTAEMWRVLRPGGVVLWYDMHYGNPWNASTRPVRRRDLKTLFPVPPAEVRTLTLLPPVARRLARWSITLCRMLEAVPGLRSHHLALFRKEL